MLDFIHNSLFGFGSEKMALKVDFVDPPPMGLIKVAFPKEVLTEDFQDRVAVAGAFIRSNVKQVGARETYRIGKFLRKWKKLAGGVRSKFQGWGAPKKYMEIVEFKAMWCVTAEFGDGRSIEFFGVVNQYVSLDCISRIEAITCSYPLLYRLRSPSGRVDSFRSMGDPTYVIPFNDIGDYAQIRNIIGEYGLFSKDAAIEAPLKLWDRVCNGLFTGEFIYNQHTADYKFVVGNVTRAVTWGGCRLVGKALRKELGLTKGAYHGLYVEDREGQCGLPRCE